MKKQLGQSTSRRSTNKLSHMINLAREETWLAVLFGIGFAGIAMHAVLITLIIVNS